MSGRGLPYRWCCLSCEAVNPGAATTCVNCGFPARPKTKDIQALQARQRGQRPESKAAAKDGLESFAEWLAPLSAPRKLMACLGLFLMIAGVIWFKATPSWADMGWSALAFLLGLGLVGLAGEAKSPTDSGTPRP